MSFTEDQLADFQEAFLLFDNKGDGRIPVSMDYINYKDTKTKCRHLNKLTCKRTLRQVFIRVYKLEIHTFWPSFVNYCHSYLLSGSPLSPPPPSMCQCTVFNTQTVCDWEGIGGIDCWILLETIFCRSLTLCIWSDTEPTKWLNHPKQKPRRGGGLRRINTFLKQFFRWRYFALLSVSLIFIRP